MADCSTDTCYMSLRDRYNYYIDNNFISRDTTFTQFLSDVSRRSGDNMLNIISVKVTGG